MGGLVYITDGGIVEHNAMPLMYGYTFEWWRILLSPKWIHIKMV